MPDGDTPVGADVSEETGVGGGSVEEALTLAVTVGEAVISTEGATGSGVSTWPDWHALKRRTGSRPISPTGIFVLFRCFMLPARLVCSLVEAGDLICVWGSPCPHYTQPALAEAKPESKRSVTSGTEPRMTFNRYYYAAAIYDSLVHSSGKTQPGNPEHDHF